MRALSSMLALAVFVGVAAAQPPAAEPAAAGSTAPAPPSAAEPPNAAELRKTCAQAMNADASFARSIIRTAINTQREAAKTVCEDVDILETHQGAVADAEENQRHVFAAYAAMWVIAAGFLFYLLRRQQHLKAEIAQLRRDLDAAAKDGKGEK